MRYVYTKLPWALIERKLLSFNIEEKSKTYLRAYLHIVFQLPGAYIHKFTTA